MCQNDQVAELRQQIELKEVAHEGMLSTRIWIGYINFIDSFEENKFRKHFTKWNFRFEVRQK